MFVCQFVVFPYDTPTSCTIAEHLTNILHPKILSARADSKSDSALRELRSRVVLTWHMRKLIWSAAACAAMVGVALAQVEASSSVYVLDIDPARYAGPSGQRLVLRVGDPPRHVTIGGQDELCVQLHRIDGQGEVISARVRTLSPDTKVADVRLVAPDISPGTYRSTPWGLLLRALPNPGSAPDTGAQFVKTVALETAQVCEL